MLNYTVEMKQPESDIRNGDNFIEVANVTEPSYTYANDITNGTTYNFRVKAVNGVGSSNYSSVFPIISATKP